MTEKEIIIEVSVALISLVVAYIVVTIANKLIDKWDESRPKLDERERR